MKNVIVTGGTGFIGSWLIQELLNNFINVVVVARNREKLNVEIRENIRCEIIEKDIKDLSKDDFEERDYDVFFHLAWEGVSTEKKNNVDIQLNNVRNAISMLEICKEIGCKRFIGAGTVAEYVFSEGVMDFDAKQSPNDMYGAAKVAAHYMLEVRASQLGQPFIWVVIPSTFGERRDDNNIITYTIVSLLNGKRPVYGKLEQMWDFLYVGEVVRAMRLVGERGRDGITYGIGSGVYFPLKKYIIKIRDLINPDLPLGIGELEHMTKQTFSSCVNIDKLKLDTGFSPTVSFEEGMIKTIEYYKKIQDAGRE